MQISIHDWDRIDRETRTRLVSRSEQNIESLLPNVEAIVREVAGRGDAALREFTVRFDGADLSGLSIRVSEEEIEDAIRDLPDQVKTALDYAMHNVRRVHRRQVPAPLAMEEIRPGVFCGERAVPIDSVGLYVPRGRGSFPSMLYMLAIPAELAGVGRVALCTPPDERGRVDPACLYAARACGVHEVFRVGGAQAVAALAYGTESVAPVAKIVGPGSAYVAAAKRIVRDIVDVGLPAGPSESMIVADASADARSVAEDLLIEAEHGADSQALLVTTDRDLAQEVARTLPGLIEGTPEPRRSFLISVFQEYGGVIIASDLDAASEVVNTFAPEHLQLRLADNEAFIDLVRNAAEILVGRFTPFSLANYAIGANAVLPTGGAARVHSGVSVQDFQKRVAVMRVTEEGYPEIAGQVAVLAQSEGFYWHAEALAGRIHDLADGGREAAGTGENK